MHKYVIERTVPGAGQMDSAALAAIAQKSNDVLRQLGPDVRVLALSDGQLRGQLDELVSGLQALLAEASQGRRLECPGVRRVLPRAGARVADRLVEPRDSPRPDPLACVGG